MSSKHVVIFATRVPALNQKGDQLVEFYRINNFLRLGCRVSLVVVSPFSLSETDCNELSAKGVSVSIYKIDVSELFLSSLKSIFSNVPFQVALFRSSKLIKDINSGKFRGDLYYFSLLRTGAYSYFFSVESCVFSVIDSLVLNFQSLLVSRGGFLRRLLIAEELRRLRIYERAIVDQYKTIFVSHRDASDYPFSRTLRVIHNGVDTEKFRPSFDVVDNSARSILFVGNMNYFPNQDAVLWFCSKILPLVQEKDNVEFVICGADPSPSIMSLANQAIHVTGRVDSVIPFYQKAKVFVAPMVSGSGIQNKILEAMACGCAVVTTSHGLGSIKADVGNDILVADNPIDFSYLVLSLLSNQALRCKIGLAARRYVTKAHSWEVSSEDINWIFGPQCR